jgi:protein-disulfide isomerase
MKDAEVENRNSESGISSEHMKRLLPFIIILAVLAAALGTAWYLKRSATQASTPAPSASPQPNVVASSDQGADPPHSLGPLNAPAQLEEFGDFECPPCGLVHPILQTMQKEFGGSLRIIFREFPLVPPHQHALAAAHAAEAAGLQGKFWEMHDLLYENQKTWHDAFDVRPIFEDYAKRIGLDIERYKKDLNSEIVERRIFLDGQRGHSLGVKGTPTIFLNGREVPFESLPADKLRGVIKAELDRTHR